MPAFIMNDKFYAHRKPAWHHLGIVSQEPCTPIEVARLIEIPHIEAKPLYVHEAEYAWRVPGYQSIVATFDGVHEVEGVPPELGGIPAGGVIIDNQTRFAYGVVADGYQLVTHQAFIEIWDRTTRGAPVETMGLLYNGNTLFLSTVLPPISVRGDEIQLFLFGHNPVNGRSAVRCRTTGIRAVCHNTVQLILRGRTEHAFRTSHVGVENVVRKIETWLTTIWEQRLQTSALMKEAYEALAHAPCPTQRLNAVTARVYPYEPQPDELDSPEGMDWQLGCLGVKAHREAVTELFESSRTITPATRGTMFGAWNAVSEYENFGRSRVSALSKVFGSSMELVEKAYDVCVDVMQN